MKTGAIYNYISRAGRGAGSWGRRNRTRGKKARDQPQKAGGACVCVFHLPPKNAFPCRSKYGLQHQSWHQYRNESPQPLEALDYCTPSSTPTQRGRQPALHAGWLHPFALIFQLGNWTRLRSVKGGDDQPLPDLKLIHRQRPRQRRKYTTRN